MQITQDETKQKNPEHSYVYIGKWKTYSKFQQKILNSMVVEARQSFQLFIKIPGFSKTIELYLDFLMGFRIMLLELSNHDKTVHKKLFYISHASYLNMRSDNLLNITPRL